MFFLLLSFLPRTGPFIPDYGNFSVWWIMLSFLNFGPVRDIIIYCTLCIRIFRAFAITTAIAYPGRKKNRPSLRILVMVYAIAVVFANVRRLFRFAVGL